VYSHEVDVVVSNASALYGVLEVWCRSSHWKKMHTMLGAELMLDAISL
jgi:hypothetical protein